VVREVKEETGVDVTVTRLIGTRPLEVLPGTVVHIVAYECTMEGSSRAPRPRPSNEHSHVAFLDPTTIPATELPHTYRDLIALRLPKRRKRRTAGEVGPRGAV
jgi:8-oxo-dGTP pyrophosphatase MutT (NUDIX family)